MRSITLHPASLAVGLVFGILVLLSMSQVPVLNARGVNIQYMPHPRDMVMIREGVPYTVPPGKLFVLTALGTTTSPQGFVTRLRLNGSSIEATTVGPQYGISPPESGSSVVPVPPGLVAPAGSVLEVIEGYIAADDARAWGYLAPE